MILYIQGTHVDLSSEIYYSYTTVSHMNEVKIQMDETFMTRTV